MESKYLNIDRNLKNVKLVIGNGFDIACGLKSDYGSFFRFSEPMYAEIQEWIHGKGELPSKATAWDFVFHLLKRHDTELNNPNYVSWKDVESVMRKVLGIDGNYIINLDKIQNGLKLNEDETTIEKYVRSKVKAEVISDAGLYYSFILEELKHFEDRFSEYIRGQMTPEYQENARRMLTEKGLLNINKNQLRSIDTFNYTTPDIFKELAGMHKTAKKEEEGKRTVPATGFAYRHINGKLGEAIFGIDSHHMSLDDPRYIFTKTYRKLIGFASGKREDFQRSYENVVIYGHSLGEADYSYFFSVLDGIEPYNFNKYGKRFILAFTDYCPSAKKDAAMSLLKLLIEYDHWKNPASTRHGLVEIMQTSDRVGFALIDTSVLSKK